MYTPIIEHAESLRPTKVVVDLSAITHNYEAIQDYVGNDIAVMPILKANAYGHGLVAVANALEKAGAPYFGVAYLEEGILLRKSNIKTPILVMGGIVGYQVPQFIKYNLTITASSGGKLQRIEEVAKSMNQTAKVHLKVDTGMERIGVHYYSAAKLFDSAISSKHCQIEGVFSHLADAENEDSSFSKTQIARFRGVVESVHQSAIDPRYIHLTNSVGTIKFKEGHFNMVRPGILLYGVHPCEETRSIIDLKPALSWLTKVVYFKVVNENSTVSYGRNWRAKNDTRMVTLPVGYGDGYFRSMSNKAQVLIRGNKYPSVGSICMDQMMINIGANSAFNEDIVTLIGGDAKASITIEQMAEWAGTIPYEILTNINTRVPRIYS